MIVARSNACTRTFAAILAAAIALQPLAAHAAAIVETLAEVPIQGLNPVKPNIVFTMDDSGSMGWDFLPDYVAWVVGAAHCRDGIQCGGATSAPGGGYTFSQYDPPVRSANYNGVYYDPSAFYRAGKKADGIAAAAASAAGDVADLNADLHASADYRKAMIAVFVKRAVEKALARS